MDDWGLMENWDEGTYCPDCDASYYDLDEKHIDRYSIRYVCPLCRHVFPGTYPSDYYYDLGLYLLSIADDEFAWPEYQRPLPKYEA